MLQIMQWCREITFSPVHKKKQHFNFEADSINSLQQVWNKINKKTEIPTMEVDLIQPKLPVKSPWY